MSPTATSAFKTAPQTPKWKGLGVVSEETTPFATAGSKKTVKTPKATARYCLYDVCICVCTYVRTYVCTYVYVRICYKYTYVRMYRT